MTNESHTDLYPALQTAISKIEDQKREIERQRDLLIRARQVIVSLCDAIGIAPDEPAELFTLPTPAHEPLPQRAWDNRFEAYVAHLIGTVRSSASPGEFTLDVIEALRELREYYYGGTLPAKPPSNLASRDAKSEPRTTVDIENEQCARDYDVALCSISMNLHEPQSAKIAELVLNKWAQKPAASPEACAPRPFWHECDHVAGWTRDADYECPQCLGLKFVSERQQCIDQAARVCPKCDRNWISGEEECDCEPAPGVCRHCGVSLADPDQRHLGGCASVDAPKSAEDPFKDIPPFI